MIFIIYYYYIFEPELRAMHHINYKKLSQVYVKLNFK